MLIDYSGGWVDLVGRNSDQVWWVDLVCKFSG